MADFQSRKSARDRKNQKSDIPDKIKEAAWVSSTADLQAVDQGRRSSKHGGASVHCNLSTAAGLMPYVDVEWFIWHILVTAAYGAYVDF